MADPETSKTISHTAASVLTLLDASKAKEVFISYKMANMRCLLLPNLLVKWQAVELVDIWRGRVESEIRNTFAFGFNGLAALGSDEDRKLLSNQQKFRQ